MDSSASWEVAQKALMEVEVEPPPSHESCQKKADVESGTQWIKEVLRILSGIIIVLALFIAVLATTAAFTTTAVTANPAWTTSLPVTVGTIQTVAGSREAGDTVADALPALKQKLSAPQSLCYHRGMLYIGQEGSIAEMDLSTWEVRLLLGKPGAPGNEGDGQQREHARVGDVQGLVVHKDELYFTDWTHHVVRKLGLPGSSAPGLVSRVAGTGRDGFRGDAGPATAAELSYPWGLAVIDGKLLIADYGNHCIRSVELQGVASGVISTVAGTPTRIGFSGDDGPACAAKLAFPRSLVAVGQVAYLADAGNSRIRSIDFRQSPPVLASFAGGGAKLTDGAPATEWQLSYPVGLTLGSDGRHMYVSCWGGSHTAYAIDMQAANHPTSLIAGKGGQDDGVDFIAATSSPLSYPAAVAAVGDGREDTVYIAEEHCIRQVKVSGGALEPQPLDATLDADQPLEPADKVTFVALVA
mmetsp:Transcript_32749/g.76818  ORF Transcript_32749/g.76818 Transcript_32749/m.76818 type:complete len:470 (-) Transcript_32749:133-1542(-)